jgi:hypothetical protein
MVTGFFFAKKPVKNGPIFLKFGRFFAPTWPF